jgi:TonB family protein
MTSQYSNIPQETLPPEDTFSFAPSLRTFGGMLLLSMVLHLGVALYLAITPRGIDGPNGVVFDVALSDPSPATPAMTTPLEEETTAEDAPTLPETTPEQVKEASTPTTEAPPPPLPILAPPSSLMFGISSGSFASFGDGLTLKDDIRVYFLDILERINTSWQKEGVGVKLASTAMLLLSIDRSGEVRMVQTLQSSGNPMHDRLLARAVTSAGPFPPVPENYRGQSFETPLRFTPPLSLMSFGASPASIPPH